MTERTRAKVETHRVIRGRRWRVSDPSLPEDVRALLVAELMSARRAVRAALRAGDRDAEADARARVHDAKVALGERGVRWWELDRETPERIADRAERTERALRRARERADAERDA